MKYLEVMLADAVKRGDLKAAKEIRLLMLKKLVMRRAG